MSRREIIKIDKEKCNGCGLCIPSCPKGALQIIDGKAALISDLFCDGLGACIGHCPQGAINIEEREAERYDERKVMANGHHEHGFSGCPGSKVMDLRGRETPSKKKTTAKGISELRQWPVQIMLVPASAPYFKNADLLIAADCVPFAYADFHEELLKRKILLAGCPKLDDIEYYKEKISQIVKDNDIKAITYAHMEVPCCFGLIDVIKSAISESGKTIPFNDVTISIGGERIR